ncbi:MAG: hypothetical protein ACK4S4_09105 [Pyrinomonadaceae bacterium]
MQNTSLRNLILRVVGLFALLSIAVFAVSSCQRSKDAAAPAPGSAAATPTDAYKQLFAAVKAKDPQAIKSVLTKKTLALAEAQAARQNSTVDKVVENGFTATTFAPSLPEIRDERVNGDMGAVEVYNIKESRWEDLPFIKEDGAWKLAVGDLFADTFKSPGMGRAQKEQMAANSAGNNMVPINANVNFNAVKPVVPKEVPMPKANANAKP